MFTHTINVTRLRQMVKITLTISPHMANNSKWILIHGKVLLCKLSNNKYKSPWSLHTGNEVFVKIIYVFNCIQDNLLKTFFQGSESKGHLRALYLAKQQLVTQLSVCMHLACNSTD